MVIIIDIVVLFSCSITTIINTLTMITTTRVMSILMTGRAIFGNSICRMSYM